ncbi:M48 family metallopeptidase [Leptothoe spongobia]|uniref:M48 family metalloprotease n=1 Tax=Leptothoe spongobia TAU-MAC 1115 TaxID=1967444 RepID=A0A947DHC1_9CYAN|nr:M48 family metallopeptidase [Leptothoe spongobia]MBT9317078.1 M48 family metalloprotease [Leptothoe spongobia TAU-MAC 1115]
MKAHKRFALLLAVGFSITLLLSPVMPGRTATPERPEHIVQTGNAEATDTPEATVEPSAEEVNDDVTETDATETIEGSDTTDEQATEEVSEEAAAEYDPEAAALEQETWFQRELIIEADRLYLDGDIAAAEELYREAKTFGWRDEEDLEDIPAQPFTDPEQLSPGGAVYWRESTRGIEAGRESQTLVPLGLLTKEIPAFIPGHLRYAERLQAYERVDDAEMVLEKALTLYPYDPDLLSAQIELMMTQEEWIEASIASRQFSLLNADHPEAERYAGLADENLDRFKSATNARIRNNAIANIFTGAAGYILTGGLYGPFTALNSSIILLQGEKSLGESVANSARKQLPLSEDEETLAYVRDIGNRLAASAGRDDFDYTFDVVLDPELNAFALPGGKIFVNAGAILDTDSEAELAGLLGHEISHAVLSHGFQLVTRGNLTASLTQYLPLPGLVTNAIVSGYSRQMERQADIVGTQILASSGYAADGMHGLMLALDNRYGDRQVIPWLASHPAPQDRVDYLQAIVENGGYNRYAYEGVLGHEAIQKRAEAELAAHEAANGKPDEDEPVANDEDIEAAVEEVKEEQEAATENPDELMEEPASTDVDR